MDKSKDQSGLTLSHFFFKDFGSLFFVYFYV